MSKAFDEIMEGLDEAAAHLQGEDVSGIRVHQIHVQPSEVKAIRGKMRLTQDGFAQILGTSVSTLRKWEQGERQPTGAARTLLRVMTVAPDVVRRVATPPATAGNADYQAKRSQSRDAALKAARRQPTKRPAGGGARARGKQPG